jgi:osmoprotectant transport system ATP-binding protein
MLSFSPQMHTRTTLITFDGVSKRFRDGSTAVDNLSLEVPTGRITVLVGPSGCGKTTSLRMINRLVEPSAGRILLDGEDIRTVNPATLRRRIGYVIQQAGLFPHRTIVDNVATVPLLLGWGRRKARARALELLERVGLPASYGSRYPFQLSGGQQQRVGVARALAADPPVMLMDEPFSAVDPVVRKSLQDEFLRLQAELSKTIVFVTHDVDEAIKLGNLVAVLRTGGHLAQFDTAEQLLAAPADEFVVGFLGADRGIRRLHFLSSTGLPLTDSDVVPASVNGSPARADGRWLLVVDPERRPLGWPRPGQSVSAGDMAALEPTVQTFVVGTDSLRSALDCALLAPSGRGVGVDGDGRVLGTVGQPEIGAAAHHD